MKHFIIFIVLVTSTFALKEMNATHRDLPACALNIPDVKKFHLQNLHSSFQRSLPKMANSETYSTIFWNNLLMWLVNADTDLQSLSPKIYNQYRLSSGIADMVLRDDDDSNVPNIIIELKNITHEWNKKNSNKETIEDQLCRYLSSYESQNPILLGIASNVHTTQFYWNCEFDVKSCNCSTSDSISVTDKNWEFNETDLEKFLGSLKFSLMHGTCI